MSTNAIKEKIDLWNQRLNTSISAKEWNSWRWQVRNSITTLDKLKKFIPLDAEEENEIKEVLKHFVVSVTPFFIANVALLYSKGREEDVKAIAKCFVPSVNEISYQSQFMNDGLGEKDTTPFSYISQLYKDRVLLFTTNNCPFYCRYCFRRRKVILNPKENRPEDLMIGDNLEKALQYIRERKEIRDVILSGGEPLSLNDNRLERIIKSLREISHVKIIRIDTKMPVVIPMRITEALVRMLKMYHPIFMTLHFVHPAEITPEVREACERLVDAGIPLGTYTPVLKGINDSKEILKRLFWELVQIRIRPYYLVQFVPTGWTEHFRVSLMESLNFLEGIHGELSGIAIPTFKVYTKGCGKVPLLPQYYIKRTPKGHLLRTWSGDVAIYEEPGENDEE